MTQRPTSVTVIGWLWRVGGGVGMVIALPFALTGRDLFREVWADPLLHLSPTVLFLWTFSSSLLCLLCGNGLLKGRSWARSLAVAYCVFGTLIAAMMYKNHFLYWTTLSGDVAFTAVMAFFLYRPDATAFFRGTDTLETG